MFQKILINYNVILIIMVVSLIIISLLFKFFKSKKIAKDLISKGYYFYSYEVFNDRFHNHYCFANETPIRLFTEEISNLNRISFIMTFNEFKILHKKNMK